jgi:hypothetical protein
MKHQRTYKALMGTALVLALGLVLLFPTGCSKLLPTEPDALTKVDDYGILPPFFKPDATDLLCDVSASKFIDSEGGVVLVKNKCMAFEFVVPADALRSKTKITIQANFFESIQDGDVVNGLVTDFGPDGLVFLKPASLVLKGDLLQASEGEVLTLYWYNPESDLWEVEQEVNISNSQAEFSVYHFSRYAIKGGGPKSS